MTTAQRYFHLWRDSGLQKKLNHLLLMQVREAQGRLASPTAGVIDSQSVPPESGPSGYDAGKKIKGRKCLIATNTLGLLVGAIVHTADIQDRDARPGRLSLRSSFSWLRHLFAEGGYAGDKLGHAMTGAPRREAPFQDVQTIPGT